VKGKRTSAGLVVLGALVLALPASGRDQIRIVGSSTVFPFATAVAEQFGRGSQFKTPVVESTGSGGGLKLFCSGAGLDTPDITNASRRIKKSEVELCARNGVTEIVEIKLGYDGIVVANARESQRFDLSRRQLFLALAREIPLDGRLVPNPNRTWKDVDPSLPDVKSLRRAGHGGRRRELPAARGAEEEGREGLPGRRAGHPRGRRLRGGG